MKKFLKEMDWGNWLAGLWAAVIGGGANAVAGGVAINMVDPHHFNAQNSDFYRLVIGLFAANATVSFFMYLKQNPVPQHLVSKTTATLTVEKTIETKPE
jgi:hypothetical protein